MTRRFARTRIICIACAAMLCGAVGHAPAVLAKKAADAPFETPAVLSAPDAALMRQAFAAVRAGKFTEAARFAQSATDPVLRGALVGEILLAPGNTKRSVADMTGWLQANTDHAQALKIYAMAAPLTAAASRPPEPGNRWGQWLVKKPPRPATPLERNTAKLAWDHYSVGQMAPALARAKSMAASPTPEGGFALWVAGLSAWRQNDCVAAAGYFRDAALKPAISNDLLAAAYFWAARAQQQCGTFEEASAFLKQAADTGDTFYGLLAHRVLGVTPGFSWNEAAFSAADWKKISASPAVRRAAGLAQIGEFALADEEVRTWWGRAPETHWAALMRFAENKKLWGAKLAIARRPPPGERAGKAAYYPLPDWWSAAGANVPRPLVLAFMRQESAFRLDTVSRANARGLMQFLPSTAREIAQDASITETDARLNDPAFAIRLGKTYLRQLANSSITNGHLIKVAASYNAGPGNVRNWQGRIPDSDPLLYLESIPLTETRDYVETVIKNYWMYQLRLGQPTPTLDALARGEWPVFPGERARFSVSAAAISETGDVYANR